MLSDYFHIDIFDNHISFAHQYYQSNHHLECLKNKTFIDDFIKDNFFETDSQALYSLFKEAIVTEPSFIIEPTLDGYTFSEDLFGTEQECIQELRKQTYHYRLYK